MPKGPLSKSDLIQKIADQFDEKLTRKDVKGIIESVASIGHAELKKNGVFIVPGLASTPSRRSRRSSKPSQPARSSRAVPSRPPKTLSRRLTSKHSGLRRSCGGRPNVETPPAQGGDELG